MGLSIRRQRRRTVEEIKHEFTALESGSSGQYVMVISGQVDAVMAVAEKLVETGKIISYRRYAAYKTALVFPPRSFRDVQAIEVFWKIHDAAWTVIDPRGQK
jgi:hypothetical protein